MSAAGEAGERAWAAICEAYWYPLYAFVRRKGKGPQEAKDSVQGFFAHLIASNACGAADRARGRFRTFLLTALQNYLIGVTRHENRRKRGGGTVHCSLDFTDAEGRYINEPVETATPERLFEREWAWGVIERVVGNLRSEFEMAGDGRRFELMSAHLVDPEAALPYPELAGQLGMTVGATKTAMHRFRLRFREQFRTALAADRGAEEDVDEEVRHLFRVLAG